MKAAKGLIYLRARQGVYKSYISLIYPLSSRSSTCSFCDESVALENNDDLADARAVRGSNFEASAR